MQWSQRRVSAGDRCKSVQTSFLLINTCNFLELLNSLSSNKQLKLQAFQKCVSVKIRNLKSKRTSNLDLSLLIGAVMGLALTRFFLFRRRRIHRLPSESDDSSSITTSESGGSTRSSSTSPSCETNGLLSHQSSSRGRSAYPPMNGHFLQDHPILISGSSPIQKLPQDLLLK